VIATLGCQGTASDNDQVADMKGDAPGGAGGSNNVGGAAGQAGGSAGRASGGNTGGSSNGGTAGASAIGGSAGNPAPQGGNGGQTPDAGAPDTMVVVPPPSNASRCDSANLSVCAGFESGALPSTWTSPNKSNPKVEKGRAARGEYALHYANLKTEKPVIYTEKLPGITSVMWGRMFLYATPGLPNGHGALVGGFDKADNWYEVGFQFHSYHGNWHPPAGTPERWMNSMFVIPGNKWVCVEWLFDGAKPDVTRIWSDGQEVMYSQSADSPTLPKVQSFKLLQIGFTPYWGSDTTDMWLDEIAASPTRIGCDR
jgi:hypothetical protein